MLESLFLVYSSQEIRIYLVPNSRNFGSEKYPIYRFLILFNPWGRVDPYHFRDLFEQEINKIQGVRYCRSYCEPRRLVYLSGGYTPTKAWENGICILDDIKEGSLFPGFSRLDHLDAALRVATKLAATF